MEVNPIAGVVILLILLIVKAIITNAKAAVNDLNESKVRQKADEGDEDSLMLLELLEKSERYTYAIDLIITSVSVMCGMIYIDIFGRFISKLTFVNDSRDVIIRYAIYILGLIVMVIIVTLFGSLIPKKFAKRNPEKKAYNMVHIMFVLMKVLRPVTALMQLTVAGIIKLFGINPKELEESVTEEGIISLVNEGHEQGVLEASEAQMISNIIEFDEKEVSDVMTNRKNIVAVDCETSFADAYRFMLDQSFSRFPLYEGDIDNIIGILNIKDMARLYISGEYEGKTLKDIARKPNFVPETQNIDVLFNDMKKSKNHMAVVIDEYGQTAGIVAFEDVLEEIVGNIMDEYDVDEKFIVKQANGAFLMRGLSSLEDVEQAIGLEIDEEEYDTLNGFLVSQLDRIPEEGEKLSVEYKGYIFDILDVKKNIIRFVRVTKKSA